MSDYRIWVNFTRFKISWKAGGLKNPKPEKSVLFLKQISGPWQMLVCLIGQPRMCPESSGLPCFHMGLEDGWRC